MLFLHETHRVVGARQDEFEAAYRDGWTPTLATDDDARLLWYTNHAHGSGASYTVVTITAITDGAPPGSDWYVAPSRTTFRPGCASSTSSGTTRRARSCCRSIGPRCRRWTWQRSPPTVRPIR